MQDQKKRSDDKQSMHTGCQPAEPVFLFVFMQPAACLRARPQGIAALPVRSCLLLLIKCHVIGIHISSVRVLVLQ